MTLASGFLIGRGAELAALRQVLEGASAGAGLTACLEGDAGIGKTALLRAAMDTARERQFTVLTAQASPMEREFTFGVVRQLFEPLLAGATQVDRAELLSGAASLAASVLDNGPSGGTPALSLTFLTHANLHGLYWLAANVAARGPVLITIDNLQWADLPSLRWLAYLARRKEGVPLAVVCTLNAGEVPTDDQLIAELLEGSLRVRVDSLDQRSVMLLTERAFRSSVDDGFAAACHDATGGNPLLLRELQRALVAEGLDPVAGSTAAIPQFGPPALARHVASRLARHSPAVIALARAVAVLEETDIYTAAALAGLSPPRAADAVAVLTGMGWLTTEPHLEYAHSLMRAAILHELSNVERYEAHARAASLLWRSHAADERVAAHLLTADPIGERWVVEVLRRCAAGAVVHGAPEIAVAYLRRALLEPLPEDVRNLVENDLGLAELHVNLPAATARISEAIERIDDPADLARMAGGLLWALYQADRSAEAVGILSRTIERVQPRDPELARELQLYQVAAATTDATMAPFARTLLAELSTHRFARPEASQFVALLKAMRQARDGTDSDEVERVAREAMTAAVARDLGESLLPPVLLVLCLISVDEAELAYQACDDTMSEARGAGQQLAYATMSVYRARAALLLGRLTDARDDAQAALELSNDLGLGSHGGVAAAALATLVESLVELGQPETAHAVLAKAGLLGELPEHLPYCHLLTARGTMRAALGDVWAGLADHLACGQLLVKWGVVNPTFASSRLNAVEAYAALGEHGQARRLADDELDIARGWGRRGMLGLALHTSARLTEGPDRVALLQAAKTTLDGVPYPLEQARVLIDLGTALRAADQLPDARRHLRTAVDLTEQCAAAPLAAKARKLLQATGAHLDPQGRDPSTITAHEHRIAAMAADGHTNREIAQEFFVTQRAIELKLTKIYRKLGITRRAQLAAALNRVTNAGHGPG